MPTIALSTGRCGTKSLSRYMRWQHEPDVGRKAIPEEFLRRAKEYGQWYGEVSQYWRYHLDWLFSKPEIQKIHLVRNPYDVVNSHYFRTVFYGKTKYAYQADPIPVPDFDGLVRLEKICHYVRHWNERFLSYRMPMIRLEDMRNRPKFPHHNCRWDRGKGDIDWFGADSDAMEILRPLAEKLGYAPPV